MQLVNNQHFLKVHEAHEQLGSHVRISPNHISISDPSAMNEIYGHGANFMKDAWYDGGTGEFRHMADARIKEEHQGMRKTLAHVFAQKTIAGFEPIISAQLHGLIANIERSVTSGKSINIRRFLNYFTIDLICELMFGRSAGCLERGDDVVDALSPDGRLYKAPFIKSLHDATTINTLLGIEPSLLPITRKIFANHPYKKAGADFDNIVYYNVTRRMADPRAKNPADISDIFNKFLYNIRGEPTNLKQGEIQSQCSVMMNAGTDTTTAALTYTIFLLYKHPAVLQRLRNDLDPVLDAKHPPRYDDISQLPYLRACIEESLRLRPASSMGLPRVVPKGGRTIAGKYIPEGVTVSVPTYTLLRDRHAFADPEAYNPSRWTAGDTEKLNRAHFPFSTGPRACIGRNIAYFEQLLVIATLVHRYDFRFQDEGFELRTIERFNSNPDEMFLYCTRREHA